MPKPLKKCELEETLCQYCPFTKYGAILLNDNLLDLCNSLDCNEAYENYLEEFSEEQERFSPNKKLFSDIDYDEYRRIREFII